MTHNDNHHDALLQDLARDCTLAAARRRRVGRRLRNVSALTIVLIAAGMLALHQAPTQPTSPVAIKAPSIPAQTETKLAYHLIESDDELLERLADQGPILLTATDGHRHLTLTRPN